MGGLCGQSRSGGAMGGGMGMPRMGMSRNSAGGFGYPASMAGGMSASQGMAPMGPQRGSPFFMTQSGLPEYQRDLLAAGRGFQGAFDPNAYVADPATGQSKWSQFNDTPEEQASWKALTQQALSNQSMFPQMMGPPPMQRQSQYAPMSNGGAGGMDALSSILGRLLAPQPPSQAPQPAAQVPGSFGAGGMGGGLGLLGQLLGVGGSSLPYNTTTGSNQNPLSGGRFY